MRIGVVGCAGRMGRMLMREISSLPMAELSGGTDRPGSLEIGTDLGILAGLDPMGVTVGENPDMLFGLSDVVIDFTTPAATMTHAALAAKHGAALVVGTTGLSPAQVQVLRDAAERTAIVYAANMSLGVNLLLDLVRRVAATLDAADWDIEIVEMHHRHKVDAPSGTALALGNAAAEGRGVDLEAVQETVRDGHTGPRQPGEIGFATLRGGDVVGDHTVIFAGAGERLELTHKAGDRAIFAKGAVRAAQWAVGQDPGFYSMKDVQGL